MEGLSENIDELAWANAVGRYQAARDAEDGYDRDVWMPAYRTDEGGGRSIPDDVNAEMERLMEVRHNAEDKMVGVPAPNVAAVVTKIDAYRRRWAGFEWTDEQWDPILADLRRLAVEV